MSNSIVVDRWTGESGRLFTLGNATRVGRSNQEDEMPRIIETGLQKRPAPHAWAVEAYGIVQSVHVPIRPDGSIESGDATRQTEVTLNDLKATLAAAGASLADVTLIQIYLTSLDHKPAVDAVYRQFFREPYPVRAFIAVSALPTPGTVIELIATTALPR
jgi:2-iminobutanoate/2-iminopropanoate deaminase